MTDTPHQTHSSANFRSTLASRVLATAILFLIVGLPTAKAGDRISVALRWCALHGSPAVTNPMGAPLNPHTMAPETDTDGVLWRRHERASDRIWIPGADITFRSGLTADIKTGGDFPIIADPCPPTNIALCQGGSNNGTQCTPDGAGGSADCDVGVTCAMQACPAGCASCAGELGDVVDEGPTGFEYLQVLSVCQTAWEALGGATLVGPIAVNINNFVETDSTLSGLKGRTERATVTAMDSTPLPRASLAAIRPRALGGRMAALSSSWTTKTSRSSAIRSSAKRATSSWRR